MSRDRYGVPIALGPTMAMKVTYLWGRPPGLPADGLVGGPAVNGRPAVGRRPGGLPHMDFHGVHYCVGRSWRCGAGGAT